MTPEEYAAAEGLPEQRPDLQSTTEDILGDYAERMGLPYTPEERAAQVENRRQMAALQPTTEKGADIHAPREAEEEIKEEDVVRSLNATHEMYEYVERLVEHHHSNIAAGAHIEARDQWDVLRMEWASYKDEQLTLRELYAAIRHVYLVLLKIRARFETSQ